MMLSHHAGDGGKKARLTREELEVSRKTIAQGRPDCFRRTCMLVCAFACIFAHETAGAARTRFPCALNLLRDSDATLGRIVRRECEGASGCLKIEAFPSSFRDARSAGPEIHNPCVSLKCQDTNQPNPDSFFNQANLQSRRHFLSSFSRAIALAMSSLNFEPDQFVDAEYRDVKPSTALVRCSCPRRTMSRVTPR